MSFVGRNQWSKLSGFPIRGSIFCVSCAFSRLRFFCPHLSALNPKRFGIPLRYLCCLPYLLFIIPFPASPPVNSLRPLYGSFPKRYFKNSNEKASDYFPRALSLNVCKGFTARKCKILNVYRSPYGFTAPRGGIYTLPFPILIIIIIVILISPSSPPSS
jgi:hypothetical protein